MHARTLTICSSYNGGLQGRIEQQAAAETGVAGDLECIKVGTWTWMEGKGKLASGCLFRLHLGAPIESSMRIPALCKLHCRRSSMLIPSLRF